MQLSEAIRLGAMLKPQAFGTLWTGAGSCALGAAYDALGCGYKDQLHETPELIQLIFKVFVSCPQCGQSTTPAGTNSSFAYTIAHLNDNHCWTREAIADWVESIEHIQSQTEMKNGLVGATTKP